MDVEGGQAGSSASGAAASGADPLWQPWLTRQLLQAPFGPTQGAPPGARPVEALVTAPEYIGTGQTPGYKLFVGDLPASLDDATFRQWLRTDPALADSLPDILDSSVSGGARSGLRKAIITFRSAESLLRAHAAIWKWWAPVPAHIEPKGWRWFGVRVMTAERRR